MVLTSSYDIPNRKGTTAVTFAENEADGEVHNCGCDILADENGDGERCRLEGSEMEEHNPVLQGETKPRDHENQALRLSDPWRPLESGERAKNACGFTY